LIKQKYLNLNITINVDSEKLDFLHEDIKKDFFNHWLENIENANHINDFFNSYNGIEVENVYLDYMNITEEE
tara:strand:- start:1198 stop:1413 length:216 start_codon:yes stop_codon:yes gene_type:complete